MKLSEIGEFGLIDRLTGVLGTPDREDLIVGIGDDAAVWRIGERFVIATMDALVEGVHFEIGHAHWADVGWKALAVNVSDVVAMGGTPDFALVTLALPADTPADDIELLYAGLAECARSYRVSVVGGDIVRSHEISVAVALFGAAEGRDGQPLILRRDGARPGDLIAVLGMLGDSAAGLRGLREGTPTDDALTRRHLRPRPELMAGTLAARGGIACGIDVSDGLLQDIGHICESSRVAATIRASDLPISDELRAAYPEDALELACTGGEDYELVLVGDRDLLPALDPMIVERMSVIGEIKDGVEGVILIDESGEEINFKRRGWDAFRE